MAGRILMAAIRLAGGDTPTLATPGRHRDLAQRLHDYDLDGGTTLFLLQTHFGHHRTLPPRYVAGRNPIECEGQHVVAAQVAAAVRREKRSQRIVRGQHVIFDEILDHRTAS